MERADLALTRPHLQEDVWRVAGHVPPVEPRCAPGSRGEPAGTHASNPDGARATVVRRANRSRDSPGRVRAAPVASGAYVLAGTLEPGRSTGQVAAGEAKTPCRTRRRFGSPSAVSSRKNDPQGSTIAGHGAGNTTEDYIRGGSTLLSRGGSIPMSAKAELKKATAARWKALESSLAAATARLRQSLDSANG